MMTLFAAFSAALKILFGKIIGGGGGHVPPVPSGSYAHETDTIHYLALGRKTSTKMTGAHISHLVNILRL